MWPDKETEIDYLNFGYMVDMVVDIATNRQLSPSTIGLYGDWGSGKSTLMRLAKKKIEGCDQKGKRKDGSSKQKSLCIEFNGSYSCHANLHFSMWFHSLKLQGCRLLAFHLMAMT